MEKQLRVVAVVGSLRRESYTRRVVNALRELVPEGMTVEIAPIGTMPLYNEDEDDMPPPAWQEARNQVLRSNAVLFATPEYNRSSNTARPAKNIQRRTEEHFEENHANPTRQSIFPAGARAYPSPPSNPQSGSLRPTSTALRRHLIDARVDIAFRLAGRRTPRGRPGGRRSAQPGGGRAPGGYAHHLTRADRAGPPARSAWSKCIAPTHSGPA